MVPLWQTILLSIGLVQGSALIKRQAGTPYDCGEKCKARKAELQSYGAHSFALGVGFLETGAELSGSCYPEYDGKTQGAACFGLFKINWWMMTTWCSDFKDQKPEDFANGKVLNQSGDGDRMSIKCLHETLNALGEENWFKAQRYGPTGLNGGWDQNDINDYETGVKFIQSYLEQGHMNDTMTTWYNVRAV